MNALTAGALGALTTNLLHEAFRRVWSDAPRVDLLGMQALAKLVSTVGDPPKGRTLYLLTLAGDFASNSIYFSVVGLFPRARPLCGLVVGAIAGFGAVRLPGPLELSESTTSRTTMTTFLTVVLYAAGGLTTGLASREAPPHT